MRTHRTHNPSTRGGAGRRAVVPAAGAMLLLAAMLSSGCAKPLLSPADERSPFDRYDAIRNDYARQYVEDEFGRMQPNLRARLSPR